MRIDMVPAEPMEYLIRSLKDDLDETRLRLATAVTDLTTYEAETPELIATLDKWADDHELMRQLLVKVRSVLDAVPALFAVWDFYWIKAGWADSCDGCRARGLALAMSADDDEKLGDLCQAVEPYEEALRAFVAESQSDPASPTPGADPALASELSPGG